MQNDRQRVWLWASLGVGALVFVVGTWRWDRLGQSWQATVRVRFDIRPESWANPPFNPIHEKFVSASNTFTDSVFCRELEKTTGLPIADFRYLGVDQARGTSIIEVKFVGRSEIEVKFLAETAVQLWRERLMTNTPADPSEFLETHTLPNSQGQLNSFRRWTWRRFGF